MGTVPARTPPDDRESPTASAPSSETVRTAHLPEDLVDPEIASRQDELREVLDLVPHHIVVLGAAGRLLYANRAVLEHYGWTTERIQASEFDVLVRDIVHSDDSESFLAACARGFAGSSEWEVEARLRSRDGLYRWFLVQGTPLRDDAGRISRWYLTGTNIEDRKQAADRIRQDERELRTIVDFLPQILTVCDSENRVVYANHAALAFTGRTLEETIGHPNVWPEIVHPDDLPAVRAVMERLAKGIGSELESRLRRPDGQYRWILGRQAPLRDGEGRVIGWFAAATDIDDRKRAEQRLQDENLALREELNKASMFEEIVGTSPRLRGVLENVSRVAPTDSTVLITGETGTGKELVARAIHKRSNRSSRSFVNVNCAAIPPALIASELFGHEKGAFTGALTRRVGRFELADGGTIFLDEIGDLPLDTQLALLRVLQEREFERLGSTRSIKVDVRVIAATNRDLKTAMASGEFRTDLYYRLSVFPIEIPPLRERRPDIPLLVAYFAERYASKAGKTIRHFDQRMLDLVTSYPWPGNVRELQNVIERAIIVCETDTLVVDENWLSQEAQAPVRPLGTALLTQEREMIEAALAEARGKVAGPSGAAEKLGLPASTLESRIRALKIRKYQFR